jgi:hypothetical protein
LTAFFAFGSAAASLSCTALLFPGSPLEPLWRLNPEAHQAFLRMGLWSVPLMFVAIGAGLVAYLLSAGVRRRFSTARVAG